MLTKDINFYRNGMELYLADNTAQGGISECEKVVTPVLNACSSVYDVESTEPGIEPRHHLHFNCYNYIYSFKKKWVYPEGHNVGVRIWDANHTHGRISSQRLEVGIRNSPHN